MIIFKINKKKLQLKFLKKKVETFKLGKKFFIKLNEFSDGK